MSLIYSSLEGILSDVSFCTSVVHVGFGTGGAQPFGAIGGWMLAFPPSRAESQRCDPPYIGFYYGVPFQFCSALFCSNLYCSVLLCMQTTPRRGKNVEEEELSPGSFITQVCLMFGVLHVCFVLILLYHFLSPRLVEHSNTNGPYPVHVPYHTAVFGTKT